MSMSRTSSMVPADIARIALRRLGELGLPPTPENYARFYNAIAILKTPNDRSEAELQSAYQVLFRVSALLDDVSDTTDSLLEGLERGGVRLHQSLDALGETQRKDSLSELMQSIVNSTTMMSETVLASQRELNELKSAMEHIRHDLAQNRKHMESDPLTGVTNRQGLEHILVREVKRSHRYESPLSVILTDLDDFMALNSQYGQVTGDKYLMHFVALARSALRECDSFVRYGNDEFLLVLPETDLNGAKYLLERLRMIMLKTPFIVQQLKIEVHFCASYAQLGNNEMSSPLLKRLDDTLNQAKRIGRDASMAAEREAAMHTPLHT
ncbi:GGDEF domain-containing protein [Burkholderiaceae bacterium DAT-1]|nr:GGDEF domain-containing protein [Burkholderiaceae bacterium DAT-1]